MAKKDKAAETIIDKDLKELYTLAKGQKTKCPHCNADIALGGDFMEIKTAMMLRLEWEKVKRKPIVEDDGYGTPEGLKDEDEKGAE